MRRRRIGQRLLLSAASSHLPLPTPAAKPSSGAGHVRHVHVAQQPAGRRGEGRQVEVRGAVVRLSACVAQRSAWCPWPSPTRSQQAHLKAGPYCSPLSRSCWYSCTVSRGTVAAAAVGGRDDGRGQTAGADAWRWCGARRRPGGSGSEPSLFSDRRRPGDTEAGPPAEQGAALPLTHR